MTVAIELCQLCEEQYTLNKKICNDCMVTLGEATLIKYIEEDSAE